MLHTNIHSSYWQFSQITIEKWRQKFLIYQYIFNCDHSYKLKTGISSHLHEKVANRPQHRGTIQRSDDGRFLGTLFTALSSTETWDT